MKRLFVAFLATLSFAVGAFAQEAAETTAPVEKKPLPERVETRTIEPVCLALGGEETIDIIGLRLSAWGRCHDLTGLDLSIGGTEAENAYGVQLALLRNKVINNAGALQVAIFSNTAGVMSGMQVSLWNDAIVAKGFQLGLINSASDVRGLQIGLLNTTNSIYGYQIGLINVIKSSPVPFFPIINFFPSDD